MQPDNVFGIFDSLVTPIALYGCEFWLPYLLSNSDFSSSDRLLDAWQSVKFETINQKCSRMILSVHNKSSRLAVLGELGRYPLFIHALSRVMQFKQSLFSRKTLTNLIGHVLTEMAEMASLGHDCWLKCVTDIEKLLKLNRYSSNTIKNPRAIVKSKLRSIFDSYWLNKLNETKLTRGEGLNHNKLRVYSQFKGCFKMEPYIQN